METEETQPKKRGRKPKAAVTETAEFKSALNDAVEKAMQGIMASLGSMREIGAAVVPDDTDAKWSRTLATAIAEMADQGTSRKRVAPEILQKRKEAKDLMDNLIIQARADGKLPKYQLRAKVYLDEILVDPMWVNPNSKRAEPTVIEWPEDPSEAMIPLNDVAKEIHSAFMDSIGSVVRVVQDKPFRVTAGGLVVNGQAPARRINQVGTGEGTQGLRIAHRSEDNVSGETLINILGTVAPPARQNNASPATARASVA
jgi:hypothetical protein